MSGSGFSSNLAAYIGRAVAVTVPLVLLVGGAQAFTETRQFEITRNGKPIGTHMIEVNRRGAGGVGTPGHFTHVLPARLIDGGVQ